MKLQIFIIDENDDKILVDKTYRIAENNSPFPELQDIVDDAYARLIEKQEDEIKVEAERLIKQDKAES